MTPVSERKRIGTRTLSPAQAVGLGRAAHARPWSRLTAPLRARFELECLLRAVVAQRVLVAMRSVVRKHTDADIRHDRRRRSSGRPAPCAQQLERGRSGRHQQRQATSRAGKTAEGKPRQGEGQKCPAAASRDWWPYQPDLRFSTSNLPSQCGSVSGAARSDVEKGVRRWTAWKLRVPGCWRS